LTRCATAHQTTLPERVTLVDLISSAEPFVIVTPRDEDAVKIAWGGHDRRWVWVADYPMNTSYSLGSDSRAFENPCYIPRRAEI